MEKNVAVHMCTVCNSYLCNHQLYLEVRYKLGRSVAGDVNVLLAVSREEKTISSVFLEKNPNIPEQ